MLSKPKEKNETDRDRDKGSSIRKAEVRKRKGVIVFKSVLWPRTRDIGNIMIRYFGCKSQQINVCKENVPCWWNSRHIRICYLTGAR